VQVTDQGCAAGTCQHTCEARQVSDCAHKWTVRYSVSSRQREQSFATLTEAQTFQLTLSTGKQTQGAMFTDPRAGIIAFLPLCHAYIEGMARANAKSKATYRSNFANPAVTSLLQGKSVVDLARLDAEVKTLLNKTLGSYSDNYRGNVRRIITGTLDECVRRGVIPRHTVSGSGRPWACARLTSGSAPTVPATCTCAGRPARTAGNWNRSSTARPATCPCPA
jgi:hypothetical protein